jgi:hypothetical protein
MTRLCPWLPPPLLASAGTALKMGKTGLEEGISCIELLIFSVSIVSE